MEVSTIPKTVMENLLTPVATPVTFKEPVPIRRNNGCKSVPPFPGATVPRLPSSTSPKLPCTSLLLLPDDCLGKQLSFGLFKDLSDPASCGVMKSSPLETPSPVKEKPKRVRKSRAGTTTRKRAISHEATGGNVEGATTLQPASPRKRRRRSAKACADAENAEKPPPRKRNRSKAKPIDEEAFCSPIKQPSFSHSVSTPSKGILGLYGLDTKGFDATHYLRDVSLEGLMAGDYSLVPFPQKQGRASSCPIDNSFGAHISSVLQTLAKPCNSEPPSQLRQASLFPKPVDSKPTKFLLDLESTPIDHNDDGQCGGSLDTQLQASCHGAPLFEGRETTEASTRFPFDTTPVVPPAEFWNKLQIHPYMSFDSLLSQSSAMLENRGFPGDMRLRVNASSVPMFYCSSMQAPQDVSTDRYTSSRLSNWLRAEPVKQEMFEELPHHAFSRSEGSKHPVEVSPTKPVEKSGKEGSGKEGLLDIDLNKQSLEAEAADSIVKSTDIGVFMTEIAKDLPAVDLAKDNVDYHLLCSKSVLKNAWSMDSMVPLQEALPTCNTTSAMNAKSVEGVPEEYPSLQQDHGTVGIRREEHSLMSAIKECKSSSETVQAFAENASSNLPVLTVPEVHEAQEICSEVPCSPGVQAIAHLLCKMANSSSSFYSEGNDENESQATTSYVDGSIRRPARTGRIVGPIFREKQPSVMVPAKEGKDEALYNQVVGNGGEKASGTEPWAATPPRQASKNVASCSHSSDSGKSSRCHLRKHNSVSKMSISLVKDQSKQTHTPICTTSFLSTPPKKSWSVSIQHKSSVVPTRGVEGGLVKLSRPRSSSSKSCLSSPMKRSTNSFSVQPRSLIGWSMKSPSAKQALPLIGEVQHGAK